MSKLKVAAFLILIASLSSCGGMQGGDIDRSKYEYRALKITDDYVDKIKNKYKKIKVLNVTAPGEFSSGLIEVSGVLRKARSSKKVSSDELSSIAISFLTSEETLSLHDPKTESFYQIAKAEYSPMYNDYKVIFMKYLYEVPFNEFIEVYITPEGLVKKLIVPIYPTSKEFLDVARGFSRPVLGVEDPIKKQAKLKIMEIFFPSLDSEAILKEETASMLEYKRNIRNPESKQKTTVRRGSFITFGKLYLYPSKPFLRYQVSVDRVAIDKKLDSDKPKKYILGADATTGNILPQEK